MVRSAGGVVDLAESGQRALRFTNVEESARFLRGELGEAAVLAARERALAAGITASQLQIACFVSGTPLLTPYGDKPIEQFRIGDQILSRSEHDPEGPVAIKIVERTFVRVSSIVRITVGRRDIDTTAMHPFFVRGKGWIAAIEIQPGDQLSSHDGQWVAVEAVTDAHEVATVYNLSVSDYCTFFVGNRQWGFSVWAHNIICGEAVAIAIRAEIGTEAAGRVGNLRQVSEQVAAAINAGNHERAAELLRTVTGISERQAGTLTNHLASLAAPREFEIGTRIHAASMGDSLRGVSFNVGRRRILDLGFEELPRTAQSGRISFQKVETVAGGGRRTYTIHFDPHDVSGPNWHKYLTDVHGQIYELNDRGYIAAFGTNNPIGTVHIPSR